MLTSLAKSISKREGEKNADWMKKVLNLFSSQPPQKQIQLTFFFIIYYKITIILRLNFPQLNTADAPSV